MLTEALIIENAKLEAGQLARYHEDARLALFDDNTELLVMWLRHAGLLFGRETGRIERVVRVALKAHRCEYPLRRDVDRPICLVAGRVVYEHLNIKRIVSGDCDRPAFAVHAGVLHVCPAPAVDGEAVLYARLNSTQAYDDIGTTGTGGVLAAVPDEFEPGLTAYVLYRWFKGKRLDLAAEQMQLYREELERAKRSHHRPKFVRRSGKWL